MRVRDIVNKASKTAIALDMISLINACVPEPFFTKGTAIAVGATGLLLSIASYLISNSSLYYKKIYINFTISGVIKTNFKYYAIYYNKRIRYNFYLSYKICYITSLRGKYYVK